MTDHEALKRYCTLTELNKGGRPVKNASYWKKQADKWRVDVIDQQTMIDMLMQEVATLHHRIEGLEKDMPILMHLQQYNDMKKAIAARAIEIIADQCLSKCGAINQLKKELIYETRPTIASKDGTKD